MNITEVNVIRLIFALFLYRDSHASYHPVDTETMDKEIRRVLATLAARSGDMQSRVDRLFGDDLPGIVRPLINLAQALSEDENVSLALAYLNGTVF